MLAVRLSSRDVTGHFPRGERLVLPPQQWCLQRPGCMLRLSRQLPSSVLGPVVQIRRTKDCRRLRCMRLPPPLLAWRTTAPMGPSTDCDVLRRFSYPTYMPSYQCPAANLLAHSVTPFNTTPCVPVHSCHRLTTAKSCAVLTQFS